MSIIRLIILCGLIRMIDATGYIKQHETNMSMSQYRMMTTFRLMIMGLLGDAGSKIEKVTFIKQWSENGLLGKKGNLGKYIFSAVLHYKMITRLYMYNAQGMHVRQYSDIVQAFIDIKEMQMNLDNMVQAIVEHEEFDPSGRIYGRRSGNSLRNISTSIKNKKRKAVGK